MKNAKFIKTATAPEHYPANDKPEIAVVGRSNVGKSSLLNCLFNRRNLVKTSATPGKTREIQFFDTDSFLFIDLPGYGYAKSGRNFSTMIETYFETRKPGLLLLLLDIRHNPTALDRQTIEWAADQNLLVVFTKADKLGVTRRKPAAKKILSTLGLDNTPHALTSASKNLGRAELIALIKRSLACA